MVKERYFEKALLSAKDLKNNLALYVPDLVYFILTGALAILFLYMNNLTHLFSGQYLEFGTSLRGIVQSRSLFARLITSLAVILFINVLIGLGTLSMKLALIKSVIRKEKISLLKAHKESHHYMISIFFIKFIFVILYLIPLIIFGAIGLAYKPVFLLMLLVIFLIWIIYRFVFLFTYPALYLKTGKEPFRTLKETVDFFNKNKVHVFLTGLFVMIIGLVVSIVFTIIVKIVSNFSGYSILLNLTSAATISYLIIKTLVDVTIGLWSFLFLFRNYHTFTSKKS